MAERIVRGLEIQFQRRTLLDTLKVTERILTNSLGKNLNFTDSRKKSAITFLEDEPYQKVRRAIFLSENAIIQDLERWGLPIDSVALVSPVAPRIEQGDLDFVANYQIFSAVVRGSMPSDSREREAASRAATALFGSVFSVVLENLPKEVQLELNEDLVNTMRQSTREFIEALGKGSGRESEFKDFAEEFDLDLQTDPNLEIVAKGAQIMIKTTRGGINLDAMSVFDDCQVAMIELLAFNAQKQFTDQITRNTFWFKSFEGDALKFGSDPAARQEVNEALKELCINDQDPKRVLEAFLSSDLAIALAKRSIKAPINIKTESREISQDLLERVAEAASEVPAKEKREKKDKKKKSPPPPRQAFPKKVRQPKVTEVQPIASTNGAKPLHIKSEPPPEYVFETDQARRLREKAEEKAERKRRRAEQYAAFLARQARRERDALIIQRRNASRTGANSSGTVQAPPEDQQVVAAAPQSPKLNKETQKLLEEYGHLLEDSDVSEVLEDPEFEHLDDESAENSERIVSRKIRRQED